VSSISAVGEQHPRSGLAGPILLGLCFFVSACPPAFGWGREGHAVVGLIAEKYMTPTARAKAESLLGGGTITHNEVYKLVRKYSAALGFEI
jgi:hypothetical protein